MDTCYFLCNTVDLHNVIQYHTAKINVVTVMSTILMAQLHFRTKRDSELSLTHYIICCRSIVYLLRVVFDGWARSTGSALPSSMHTGYKLLSNLLINNDFVTYPYPMILSILFHEIIYGSAHLRNLCCVGLDKRRAETPLDLRL